MSRGSGFFNNEGKIVGVRSLHDYIDKPIFEIIDKKKVRVGIQKQAKCNYYSIDLACDSYGNSTSTLKRHI